MYRRIFVLACFFYSPRAYLSKLAIFNNYLYIMLTLCITERCVHTTKICVLLQIGMFLLQNSVFLLKMLFITTEICDFTNVIKYPSILVSLKEHEKTFTCTIRGIMLFML